MFKYSTEYDDARRIVLVSEKIDNDDEGKVYDNPRHIYELSVNILKLGKATEEHLYCFCLNNSLHVTGFFEVSHGTSNYSVCSCREIFMKALLAGANHIILVHNHPSDSVEPSSDDIECTKRVIESGKILNVHLQDHIIIAKNDYTSLRCFQNNLEEKLWEE